MYYPIGDIHGRFDLLEGLYGLVREEIERNPDYAFGDTIVFLGDYIDRGPQSKEVLDFLMGLEDTENVKHNFLLGNHEEFMIHCRRNEWDKGALASWLHHGGEQTLAAFGKTVKQLRNGHLDKYVNWMRKLPLVAYDYDYVFVHAAVSTAAPLDNQPRDHCLWAFETYDGVYRGYNRIVVHGHITRKVDDVFDKEPHIDIANNRIWMEVGANFNNHLAAVALPQPFDPEEEIKVIKFKA